MDAFREIGTWKDFADIFPLCNFIVTSRPGSKENDPLKGTGIAVKKLFCYDFKRKNYRHQSGTRVYFDRAYRHRHLSFRNSRARAQKAKSIRYLVPSEVEKYIKRRAAL